MPESLKVSASLTGTGPIHTAELREVKEPMGNPGKIMRLMIFSLSQRENFKVVWVPYLVLMKKSELFLPVCLENRAFLFHPSRYTQVSGVGLISGLDRESAERPGFQNSV